MSQNYQDSSDLLLQGGWNGTSALLIAERLGGVLTRMGKHGEAEEYFKLAVGGAVKGGSELKLTGEGPWVHLGRQFLGTMREDGAIELFQAAMRLNKERGFGASEAGWR